MRFSCKLDSFGMPIKRRRRLVSTASIDSFGVMTGLAAIAAKPVGDLLGIGQVVLSVMVRGPLGLAAMLTVK